MKQIVVTLENGADSNFMRRIIENMRGVLHTSVRGDSEAESSSNSEEWLQRIHSIRNDIDHSLIDMDDERTRHILQR